MKYTLLVFIFFTSCITVEHTIVIDKEEVEYQDNIEVHQHHELHHGIELEEDTLEFDVHKLKEFH